jgi:hypothetical protein
MIGPIKLKNKKFKYQFQKKNNPIPVGVPRKFLILTYDYDTLDDEYDLKLLPNY